MCDLLVDTRFQMVKEKPAKLCMKHVKCIVCHTWQHSMYFRVLYVLPYYICLYEIHVYMSSVPYVICDMPYMLILTFVGPILK